MIKCAIRRGNWSKNLRLLGWSRVNVEIQDNFLVNINLK
jgi:hypothetical protein